MHVVIAGGSGFLGHALAARLRADGDSVTILTRHTRPRTPEEVHWPADGSVGPWAQILESADAVVNLAGENISGKRWSPARKAALRDSRLLATSSLVDAIMAAETPPRVLISASGVNYYGAHGSERLDERTPPGTDFLATLCVEWERTARAASARTRVAIVRNGVVLHPSGGALPKMVLPFRFGAGGHVGTGQQYLAWIHLTDWIELVLWLIDRPDEGAFNATAPEPATSREFARALGRALHRPSLLPVPGFALRLAVGELADLLLTGQRVVPARALAGGFAFRFPTIEAALDDLF